VILVTGGTGFVGRSLVPRLVSAGHGVRVLSRASGTAGLPQSVQWAQGDLTRPATIRAALLGVDTVVHAAAVVGGSDELLHQHVNAQGTAHLAAAAREAGVRSLIHVSSAGVYGDGTTATPHAEVDTPEPRTAYERSKLGAELALTEVLASSDVRWTILRPQGLYGPDRPATAAFFRTVARRRLWIHGPGQVIVHPTHVLDLVSAILLLLRRGDHQGEIFNIGGERAVHFRDLIEMVGRQMGRGPRQVALPALMGRWARLAQSLWPIGTPALLDRLGRRIVNRSVSIEKIRAQLGFEPMALEFGLGQTAAALQGRPFP
jgi:nucleoside-diphosphate-sugar epimerase